MYKKDVISYYITQEAIAEVLNIKQSSVSQWDAIIPEKQALRLDRMHNPLVFDSSLYADK